jgi:hypothetical protein
MLEVVKFTPLPPLTQQRGRLIQLMRRHVHAEDASMADHTLVCAAYARFCNDPELHRSREHIPSESAKLFDQRQRYTEIMRGHVRASDAEYDDLNFVSAVYERYADREVLAKRESK